MSIVVLAEKPSVAEDIAKMLNISKKEATHWSGNDIVVTWAVGHMLELKYMDDYNPEFKNWRKTAADLPFVPDEFEFKPKAGSTRKQLTAIKKLMSDKEVTEIVNACDAAREGELIFQTIYRYSKSKSPVSRMWLQSMTTDAIQRAWDERKSASEYQNLADAAYSRSYADWLIGMNGSRIAEVFLPKKRTERISLGRVQTATLAILVDHEIEILKHIATPFWTLNAQFEGSESSWNGRWEGGAATEDTKPHWILTPEDKERIQALVDSGEQATVTQKVTTSKERPPLNFDLTTLQRQANSMFSWPAKRTLNVAQALYERHKLTTYPRTDSRFLPTDMKDTIDTTLSNLGQLDEMSGFIDTLTKNGMQNVARNFNDAKVSDHFAIIPTGKLPTSALSKDEQRLYNMIVRNFIASWYGESVIEKHKRTANLGGEIFNKEAQQYATLGWREVVNKNLTHPEGWGTVSIENPNASISSHEWSEEKSKPPSRIKEARLLSLMEKAGKDIEDEDLAEAMAGKGLGTPATRADTIEKLLSRGYISRQQSGALNATPHGIRIIELLRRIPVEWIASPELTGEMEASLTAVQRGELDAGEYMEKIVQQTRELVERIRNHDRSKLFENDESIGTCPLCGSNVIETALSYPCENNEGKDKGCSFVLWKDTSGRWFDRQTATKLLEEREINDLHGFFNRNGETYETSVVLSDEGKVTSAKSTGNRSNPTDEALGPCPTCHGTIRETDTHYACDQDGCKFAGVGKIICKRAIKPEEAKAIIVDGKSPLIDDFISRRGRPFKAFLVLEGTKVGFEFPPREAAADARKFEVQPGVVAVCPKFGAEIYETETHYRPRTSATGCKIDIPREISKRVITREEAKELIEKGQIGPFDDLIAKKTGNPYTAILYLKKISVLDIASQSVSERRNFLKFGPLCEGMDYDYDVIIIGAGPVGGYTARLLCERGLSVLMVEEHNEVGRPFQCAGLVTPSAMDAVEAYDTVVEDVDGALIHGPSGTLVPVGKEGELRTYVVCRKRFDQTVVQQGLEAGSDLLLESQPVSANVFDEGVEIEIINQRTKQKTTLSSKLLIGCDGAHSWVRRKFKMGYPKEMLVGFQTEVVGYLGKNRWLEMYSGSEIAPGFFAWVIPSGNGTHRIGLWSRADLLDGRTVLDCYNDLLKHPLWKERFENITETARYCGPVPSGMIRKPFKERVMVLGDAAGMAKPTTGGGLGPGFKQISTVVDDLVEKINENKLSEKDLKSVTKRSWPKLKKEQDRARALRDLLVSTRTDEELDEHFANFAKPEVISLINEVGDIEKPVPLGLALLKKVPAFRKLALQAGVKLLFT